MSGQQCYLTELPNTIGHLLRFVNLLQFFIHQIIKHFYKSFHMNM